MSAVSHRSVAMVMPSLGGGGAERVAIMLSSFLVENEVDFSFLLTKSEEIVYPLPPQVRTTYIGSGNHEALDQIAFIRKEMEADSDRVFLSFLPHQNLFTLLAAIGLRNRVIVAVRNYPMDDFPERQRLLFPLRDVLYGFKADCVVFQTQRQKEVFNKAISRKSCVIPNPLSDDLPKPVEGGRRKVVVASGRLVEQKNYPMLLRAFRRVYLRHPDYGLEIYGEGDLKDDLKSLCSQLGIEQVVDFRGFRSDAPELIRTASVYAMASDWEGLSNSLIEALAMGVPTVCTRCEGGGAEAVLTDGWNGFLVDRNDDEGMAERIESLISDEKLATLFSQNARKIRGELSLGKIGEEWLCRLFAIGRH